jgi:hypothetical protein
MRTTIDIDDDVLAAARDLARAEGRTMGQVISELARRALTTPTFRSVDGASVGPTGVGANGIGFNEPAVAYLADDWPTFPPRGGPPVTNELIERLEDEIARDDGMAFDHATGKPA